MINNYYEILPLLKFDSEDDFYFLQIIQRKKDNPEIGSNNRTIKTYYIRSEEYLSNRYIEIRKICDCLNARAYIHPFPKSFERVSFMTLSLLAENLAKKEFTSTKSKYDSACGLATSNRKLWVIDCDNVPSSQKEHYQDVFNEFTDVKAVLDTKSGIHLIVKPFDLTNFTCEFVGLDFEVHKNNPTILCIPSEIK